MKTREDTLEGPPRKARRPLSRALLTTLAVAVLALFAASAGGAFRRGGKAPEPCGGSYADLACQADLLRGPDDPCRFVRVTEAVRAIGQELNGLPGRTKDKCFMPDFSIRVVTESGPTAYQAAVRGLTDRLALGSQAYWDQRKGLLHVLVLDRYVAVEITPRVPGAREKAIALAGLALAKIGPAGQGDG